MKDACNNAQDKRPKVNAPKMKQQSLFDVVRPKGKGTSVPVPSTTPATAPLPSASVCLSAAMPASGLRPKLPCCHAPALPPKPLSLHAVSCEQSVELVETPSVTQPSCRPPTLPPKPASLCATSCEQSIELIETPAAPLGILSELCDLEACLSEYISQQASPAEAADPLAYFHTEPEILDDPSVPSDEIWETFLNKNLKGVFGWKSEFTDSLQVQKTDGAGMKGLVHFVEYFVTKQGIPEAMFEGKLLYLISELCKM